MPCPWERTPSGTLLVHPCEHTKKSELPTYVYCRVSSSYKKDDLQRQVGRCCEFCEARGWIVERVFKEVASGMNDKRRQLCKLFEQSPGRLVVEHKDRLTRFGFNYMELLLPKLGWEVVVINRDEHDRDDLMKDLVAIVTSFCCRLYGLRRGKAKAQELTKDA